MKKILILLLIFLFPMSTMAFDDDNNDPIAIQTKEGWIVTSKSNVAVLLDFSQQRLAFALLGNQKGIYKNEGASRTKMLSILMEIYPNLKVCITRDLENVKCKKRLELELK
jgi:hypothetical protein